MGLNIQVILFCYNESIIIRQTIEHYRRLLPSCVITILDNMSTDNSVAIARQLGCKINQYNTNNQLSDYRHEIFRNDYWKRFSNTWVIFADMDEWLCLTEQELIDEDRAGVTVLRVKGYNMIGDSKNADCSDINLHKITKGIHHPPEDKNLCFKAGPIREMFFASGGHFSDPKGAVKYSQKVYILKHMDYLGLPYKLNKQKARFERNKTNRLRNMGFHYDVPLEEIASNHENVLNSAEDLSELVQDYS